MILDISPVVLAELGLSLIAVFSVIAILVTQFNDLMAAILKLRARNLEDAVVDLLRDPQLAEALLSHPRIALRKPKGGVDGNVTWIEDEAFVDTLIDLLLTDSQQLLVAPLTDTINSLKDTPEKERLRLLVDNLMRFFSPEHLALVKAEIERVPDPDEKSKLTAEIEKIEQFYLAFFGQDTKLAHLIDAIENISRGAFNDIMRSLLRAVDTLDEARDRLTSWFDNGMWRATELYKERIKLFSFIIAIIIVFAFNIDTVQISRVLLSNDEARTATAAFTQTQLLDMLEAEVTDEEGTIQEEVAGIQQSLAQLQSLSVPIGWTNYEPITVEFDGETIVDVGNEDLRNLYILFNPSTIGFDNWLRLFITKILGLGITIIAAAQGAPFWFDLLNRLMGKGD